jgi:hypothetical protein
LGWNPLRSPAAPAPPLLPLLLLLQWDEPSFGYTNGTAAAQSDIDLFLCPSRTLNTACKAGENQDNNVSAVASHCRCFFL